MKLKFKSYQGYGLMMALILTCYVFSLYYHHYIAIALFVVFLGILVKQNIATQQSLIFGVLLLLALYTLLFINQKKQNIPQNSAIVSVYADDLTINNSTKTFFGEGYIEGQKILLTGQNSDKLSAIKQSKISLIIKKGQLQLLSKATNIGQFDSRNYYQSLGISVQANINDYEVKSALTSNGIGFLLDSLHQLRYRLKQFYEKLPRPLNMLGMQLILGEKSPDLSYDDTFRDLGIIHIISISGLHVQVIAKILEKIGYLLKIKRKYAKFLTVIVLMAFIVIGNEQVGLVRAVVSYCLAFILRYFLKKQVNPLDQLGFGYIIHTLINPLMITTVGGQLSYFLVFILILTQKLSFLKQTLLLNIASLPLLLFYFSSYNVFTILYNFIAIPLFDYLILPVTLLSFLYSLLPAFFDIIANLLLQLFDLFKFLANLQYGMITFGKPSILMVIVLLLLPLLFVTFKTIQKQLVLMLTIGYLVCYGMIHYPFFGEVTFIDVGQGDSILLTTPLNRQVFLIDTGGKVNFSKKPATTKSTVEKVTVPYLKSLGISQIDAVFLTHQDDDHMGDLEPLIENIKIGVVYYAAGMQKVEKFKQIVLKYQRHISFQPLQAGNQLINNAIQIEVLHPFNDEGKGRNQDSLALLVSIQKRKLLFTGDLEKTQEEAIIKKYPDLTVDYLKLGHHGSKTSSSKQFLQAIKPAYVFILAGKNNRYHHPNEETINTLDELQIKYDGTYQYGMINLYFNAFDQWSKSHYQTGKEDDY